MSGLIAMLSANGSDLTAVRGSGSPTITPEMVAAACRGLTRHIYLYVLRKHALDKSSTKELIWLNRNAVRRRARMEKWNRADPVVVDRFAGMTLFQAIDDNHCHRCNGTGNSSVGVTCGRCSGSGAGVPLSMEDKGRDIGVSKTAYSKTWLSRERAIAGEFQYFDQYVDSKIKREVFGE